MSGLFGLLGLWVPLIGENLLIIVAGTFLYLPAWILFRRNKELHDYGFRADPIAKGLLLFVAVVLIVMPPFALGHHAWQAAVFERGLAFERDRLVRFEKELDDRPPIGTLPEGLHVWIEGQRLMVLWTGDGTADVQVVAQVREAGLDRYRELRGFRPDGDLLKVDGSLAKVQGDALVWSRDSPGGFSFSLAGIESFALTSESVGELRTGRWSVSRELSLEVSRGAWWWLWMFVSQLILVAIPEEWFYRGYLQQRFDEAWAPRWRILGVTLGWGWLLSSALFALGHLVLDPRPERLAVFFPSLLFGWMRARTGSILAPVLFHAFSNVWIQTLAYLYI